jgi:hypothetical protein
MTRNSALKITMLAAFALCGTYLFGALSYSKGLWPIAELRAMKSQIGGDKRLPVGVQLDELTRLIGFRDKREITCPVQTDRTAVLLVIGQSNAGNSSGQRYTSAYGDRIINYSAGKCFIASSPLLGSTGTAGESWTLLGNKLLSDEGFADRVILIPAGIGGSPIKRWVEGGDLNEMLQKMLDGLSAKYRVTQVLWHQGEADFLDGTTAHDYARMFLSLVNSIRKKGISAPIYVSVATKCELVNETWVSKNSVALAQESLVDSSAGIFSGVDTDSLLGPLDRYDDCHFGQTGQEKFASAWAQILKAKH